MQEVVVDSLAMRWTTCWIYRVNGRASVTRQGHRTSHMVFLFLHSGCRGAPGVTLFWVPAMRLRYQTFLESRSSPSCESLEGYNSLDTSWNQKNEYNIVIYLESRFQKWTHLFHLNVWARSYIEGNFPLTMRLQCRTFLESSLSPSCWWWLLIPLLQDEQPTVISARMGGPPLRTRVVAQATWFFFFCVPDVTLLLVLLFVESLE